jgi:hypothetical protein
MTAHSLFVTPGLSAKTHCHHNFGYESRKSMIPWAVMPAHIGPQYALEGNLVYN